MLVGSLWLAPGNWRSPAGAVLRVESVRAWWNGAVFVPMVYAERLDDGAPTWHPRGAVRQMAMVGVFERRKRWLSEAEAAAELARRGIA